MAPKAKAKVKPEARAEAKAAAAKPTPKAKADAKAAPAKPLDDEASSPAEASVLGPAATSDAPEAGTKPKGLAGSGLAAARAVATCPADLVPEPEAPEPAEETAAAATSKEPTSEEMPTPEAPRALSLEERAKQLLDLKQQCHAHISCIKNADVVDLRSGTFQAPIIRYTFDGLCIFLQLPLESVRQERTTVYNIEFDFIESNMYHGSQSGARLLGANVPALNHLVGRGFLIELRDAVDRLDEFVNPEMLELLEPYQRPEGPNAEYPQRLLDPDRAGRANLSAKYFCELLLTIAEYQRVSTTARLPAIVITCDHMGELVKCTNAAGVEVASCKVPPGQEPFGPWLWDEAVGKAKKHGSCVHLVGTNGEVVFVEQPDEQARSVA